MFVAPGALGTEAVAAAVRWSLEAGAAAAAGNVVLAANRATPRLARNAGHRVRWRDGSFRLVPVMDGATAARAGNAAQHVSRNS